MSVTATALIISILYIQVRGVQPNGANSNISSLVFNKTSALQSQNLQSRLNQLSQNQASNVKPSENFKLPKNLQQMLNLQQATNKQQAANLQQANLQQTSNIQQVPNLLQANNLQQVSNAQNVNALPSLAQQAQLQSSLTGPQASNLQQSMVVQQPMSVQQSTNTMFANHLQPNTNMQQLNQNPGSLQILRQASDVSVLPNAQMSPQYTQAQMLGANPTSNSAIITSIPSSQTNYCNSPGDVLICPQNQQVSYSGVPAYAVDMSQLTNTPVTMSLPTGTNQPSIVTILTPQQNQQPYVVQGVPAQNPTDHSNQITIIKSVQPHSSAQYLTNQDPSPITFVPGRTPTQPISYTEALPTIDSILTSTLTKQASKSSSLKSLLPLLLNLIKERNSCDCHHNCDCTQKTKPKSQYHGGGEIIDGYSKQRKYGHKPDLTLRYSNENSDEFDSRESRRYNKKYGRVKNIEPESAEYDYSEEFQDD